MGFGTLSPWWKRVRLLPCFGKEGACEGLTSHGSVSCQNQASCDYSWLALG